MFSRKTEQTENNKIEKNQNMKKVFSIAALALLCSWVSCKSQTRWTMTDDGGIEWSGKQLSAHRDHVEMSGKRVSVVFRYGIGSKGASFVNKGMVWPLLRTVPNNTHASLMRHISWDVMDQFAVDNHYLSGEKVKKISLKGVLCVESEFPNGLTVERTYFPSTEKPAAMEIMKVVNAGSKTVKVSMPYTNNLVYTDPAKGVTGSYAIRMQVCNPGNAVVEPGESIEYYGIISATEDGGKTIEADCRKELAAREAFVGNIMDSRLVLKTPDETINRMFAFSKIRACESIYETAGGPMHGPGGESYYAAVWTNDQAEYINPYFPFVGYGYGNASALNSYLMFAKFMNDEGKPIPSSIIAEGKDIWNGAGDRGDAAMIAYGAARYALARGDMGEARQLWPLVKWCLDYCKSKLNADGVVASDCDELEGRFPAGNANLCTSSLYYDALLSASYLAPLMGERSAAAAYRKEARVLRTNINRYFAGPVEGFDTYRYYEGNNTLRSWICIPLVTGIDEKAKGTIDALFSPRLWTENGMLTQAGTKTYWDRSTLYGLRGALYVGATDKAMDFLHRYSETRLLGDHVPYAIEAWPEGSQRHLSAESGLYGRIITEGLFGIRPTGFRSFSITPHLPSGWNEMELDHIFAFGSDFNIRIERAGKKLLLTLTEGSSIQKVTIANGQCKNIVLKQ